MRRPIQNESNKAGTPAITRRGAMREAAKKAAYIAPIVMTMATPSAYAASAPSAPCIVNGDPCTFNSECCSGNCHSSMMCMA